MQIVTISGIMVRDHDKIVKLLNELENYINLDKETLKKVFDIFRWELEKHIFTEERVIFISYNPEDKEEGYTMIPQLMIDHKNILDRLKEIQKRIKSDKNCNFQDFKEFLIQHKDFEENFFYPKLDQELDETTKDMIFKRIGEIKLDEKVFKKIKLKCSECGKKLGIMEGYHYPKFEKRWFFCRKCYDEIEKKQAKKII
jgi:iron-sulfur cluster repair protein YtfE (RIC family)